MTALYCRLQYFIRRLKERKKESLQFSIKKIDGWTCAKKMHHTTFWIKIKKTD